MCVCQVPGLIRPHCSLPHVQRETVMELRQVTNQVRHIFRLSPGAYPAFVDQKLAPLARALLPDHHEEHVRALMGGAEAAASADRGEQVEAYMKLCVACNELVNALPPELPAPEPRDQALRFMVSYGGSKAKYEYDERGDGGGVPLMSEYDASKSLLAAWSLLRSAGDL
jgi:hypothetical protein